MRPLTRAALAALALSLLAPSAVLLSAGPAAAATSVDLVPVASYDSTSGNVEGGAEIVAFDPTSRRAFTTNDPVATPTVTLVDVVDLTVPAAPVRLPSIDLSLQGASSVQGVAVAGGVLAAAVSLTSAQQPGAVLLYDAATSAFLRRATVGALPDAIAFTPDGSRLVVANEGEAACVSGVLDNPEGSVSVVTVATGAVATARFTAFDGQAAALRSAGVRLVIPGSTVSQELEPEFPSITPDGSTAYVTLQEANAVATVDLTSATPTVTTVRGVGAVDFGVTPIDASDQDGPGSTPLVNLRTRKAVGLVNPDGIAQLATPAGRFLLLAGEGDARDYLTPCVAADVARLSSNAVRLDPTAYPDSATIKMNGTAAGYGRLTVSLVDGDTDADGDIDQLTVLGSRSLRVVRPDGTLVADTGNLFETLVRDRFPASFNTNSGSDTRTIDTRSDDKGPEPESVVVGRVGSTDLAFVALERVGGIATLEVTDPTAPALVGYDNPALDGSTVGAKDRAPEGLQFVPAAQAPGGVPLLLVSNEGQGTTTVYEVRLTVDPAPSPSASPSSSPPASPPATATATVSPSPSVSVSPTMSASPSPVVSLSPSPAGPPAACATPATVVLERDAIVATGASGVAVRGPVGASVDLLAYTRPSTTYRVVRSGVVGPDGSVAFSSLRPPANTRLYAVLRGCPPGTAGATDPVTGSVVLNVRTALTIAAERLGRRSYAFTGDSVPARPGGLGIDLYRVEADGTQVLTAQTQADPATGEWRIERRFSGAGRFGFVVRTRTDLQNTAGASGVRSTLVF